MLQSRSNLPEQSTDSRPTSRKVEPRRAVAANAIDQRDLFAEEKPTGK